jgi:hypothetical protein
MRAPTHSSSKLLFFNFFAQNSARESILSPTNFSSQNMNKKLIFSGLVVLTAGFVVLTAFGPKQDAQKAEIAGAVTAKLEEYKAELQAACDERVAVEAKKRFDEQMATIQLPATNNLVAAPKKKAVAKGPNVKPLPKTQAPADPSQAKKDKTAGEAAPNTEAKQSKTAGEAPPPNTDKKKAKTAGQLPNGGN